MSKIVEQVQEIAEKIASGLGLEILEVEYKKLSTGMELTVFIDKDGGVFLDDCENFHRVLDAELDVLDPTAGAPYRLNVSSPGLDRPLKTERDFKRNLGKEVEVSLYRPHEKLGKKFEAVLTGFSDASVTFGEIVIEKSDIALIKQIIRF